MSPGTSLLKEFPEQIDGLHRFAEVFEARGDNTKAAEYYRKTAEFAEQEEGFGKESVIFLKTRLNNSLKRKNNFPVLYGFQ